WYSTFPLSSRCARATLRRPGRSGSSDVAHSTMVLPSNVPSLWRIDIVTWSESYQNVVNLFVRRSKPDTPVPVLFGFPLSSSHVNSDSRKWPSWTIFCVHLPCVLIGSPPLAGKNDLTTSHLPAICARSACPAPGFACGSLDCCDSLAT